MAFIEERDDELGEVEEEGEEGMEKKQAMEVREELRIAHSFSFLPPSSSSTTTTTTTTSSSSFQHHYFIPPPVFDSSTGGGETSARSSGEREHMFEKVVTPSDVGKLNRLVIPKQHAERYFPLDSSSNEKGLLLSFEDRSGKPWRFRYSYWNSSQSYVMTKGWSRFVKEKKLDAGDVVSFDRSGFGTDNERFFIDWRRRPDVVLEASLRGLPVQYHHPPAPWGRLFFPPMISPRVYSNHMHFNYGYYCLRPPPPIAGCGGDGCAPPAVFESVPVAHGKAAAAGKRVRLFGVNLEQCTSGEESSSTSSTSAIAKPATASLLPLLPPPQLRLCGGDDSTAQEELQRKGKPSLSLNLDI